MRSLTGEEIDYLSKYDLASMARLPEITTKIDHGNHAYDKDMTGGEALALYLLGRYENRIPRDKYSLTMIMLNNKMSVTGIATLDMGERLSPEERAAKNLDYPVSLRDIWTIEVLSGAAASYLLFNHPEQYGPKVKKASLYEDEITLSLMSDLDERCKLKDAVALNLDKMPFDPSKYFFNPIDTLHERLIGRSREYKAIKQTRKIFLDRHNNIGKMRKEGLKEEFFDFSFGGMLPGMNKSHLEKWEFYLDKDQIEPVKFDDWKMKEIQFTADKLLSNKVIEQENAYDRKDKAEFIADMSKKTKVLDEENVIRANKSNNDKYNINLALYDGIIVDIDEDSLENLREGGDEEEDKEI